MPTGLGPAPCRFAHRAVGRYVHTFLRQYVHRFLVVRNAIIVCLGINFWVKTVASQLQFIDRATLVFHILFNGSLQPRSVDNLLFFTAAFRYCTKLCVKC